MPERVTVLSDSGGSFFRSWWLKEKLIFARIPSDSGALDESGLRELGLRMSLKDQGHKCTMKSRSGRISGYLAVSKAYRPRCGSRSHSILVSE